jgi:hypothetical protein
MIKQPTGEIHLLGVEAKNTEKTTGHFIVAADSAPVDFQPGKVQPTDRVCLPVS